MFLIICLLLYRIRFLQVVEHDLAFQALNSTRANLCELLSSKYRVIALRYSQRSSDLPTCYPFLLRMIVKLLRTFSESELESVSILTRPYSPFSVSSPAAKSGPSLS